MATLTVGACMGVSAPTGLIAWWRFEGNLQDAMGTNHGISKGAEIYGPAVVGNGFTTDRRSGFIEVPSSPGLNPTNGVTVEAWHKAEESFADPAMLVRKAWVDGPNAFTHQYSLVVQGNPAYSKSPRPVNSYGLILATTFGSERTVYTPANIHTPGNWYHVVGTFDKQVAKIYVNGQLQGSATYIMEMPVSSHPLTIGGSSAQGSTMTNSAPGALDEVSIYDRALTADEIAALYNAGSNGKCLAGSPVPPVITDIVRTNSTITLTWSAMVGQKYEVQAATLLDGLSWTNLSGTITSTAPVLQYSDTLAAEVMKFYRVRLVP